MRFPTTYADAPALISATWTGTLALEPTKPIPVARRDLELPIVEFR